MRGQFRHSITFDLADDFAFKLHDRFFHNARISSDAYHVWNPHGAGFETGSTLILSKSSSMMLTGDALWSNAVIYVCDVAGPDQSKGTVDGCKSKNLRERGQVAEEFQNHFSWHWYEMITTSLAFCHDVDHVDLCCCDSRVMRDCGEGQRGLKYPRP